MSSLSPSDSRRGLGLESLDVGSCSLDEKVLSLFKSARMPNLRSLTLHHNPLTTTKPDYVEALQGYGSMPKLQIVDNKRVVEKKKHEPVPKKSKNKKRDKEKARPTGTNDAGTTKMRQWGDGTKEGDDGAEKDITTVKGYKDIVKDGSKEKKRKRGVDAEIGEGTTTTPKSANVGGKGESTPKSHASTGKEDRSASKRAKHDSEAVKSKSVKVASSNVPMPSTKAADPSALTSDKAHRHSQNETGVYGVVEVGHGVESAKASKGKREKRKGASKLDDASAAPPTSGGIDLKAMFNKSDETGLGVGGW